MIERHRALAGLRDTLSGPLTLVEPATIRARNHEVVS
jgi:hypothetical protein